MERPQISVTASTDRISQREQIDQVMARARVKQEPVRIRIPFQLYDHDTTRGYINVRDASWNLTLPINQVEVVDIEELIRTVDRFVRALGEVGSSGVLARLEGQP